MAEIVNGPRFVLGKVVATPGALSVLEAARQPPLELLRKHVSGDWGVVCADTAALNDQALLDGERVHSAYVLATKITVWVITEADRSSTCIMLPEEY
jgi:hypothetical protein